MLLPHQTLERAMCFKLFENMQVISLYWFAVQQQTSAW